MFSTCVVCLVFYYYHACLYEQMVCILPLYITVYIYANYKYYILILTGWLTMLFWACWLCLAVLTFGNIFLPFVSLGFNYFLWWWIVNIICSSICRLLHWELFKYEVMCAFTFDSAFFVHLNLSFLVTFLLREHFLYGLTCAM